MAAAIITLAARRMMRMMFGVCISMLLCLVFSHLSSLKEILLSKYSNNAVSDRLSKADMAESAALVEERHLSGFVLLFDFCCTPRC
jgi:hypothetical protein